MTSPAARAPEAPCTAGWESDDGVLPSPGHLACACDHVETHLHPHECVCGSERDLDDLTVYERITATPRRTA